MQNLIDGDFAANNGGWQWSASTGTDSQPYFRIFNPLLQSRKFDATGTFLRQWISELSSLDNSNTDALHDPFHQLSTEDFALLNYPLPIVLHVEARERAIKTFRGH